MKKIYLKSYERSFALILSLIKNTLQMLLHQHITGTMLNDLYFISEMNFQYYFFKGSVFRKRFPILRLSLHT